jgi:NTE family protein
MKLKKENNKNIAIILQGGGSKGAYQVGSILAISEIIKDITNDSNPFSYITGISVGSINATYLATVDRQFNKRVIALKNKWLSLRNNDVYDIGRYGILSSISNVFDERKSLFTLNPLHNFINKEIVFDSIISNKILNIHAYSYDDSKNIIFSNKNKKIKPEHIVASSSVPYVFNETIIDGKRYGDGGLSLRRPSNSLIKDGATKILGLSLDFDNDRTVANAIFKSIFPDSLQDDFDTIKTKNLLVNRFNPFNKMKNIETLLLKPEIEDFKINENSINTLPKSLRFLSKIIGLDSQESNSILNYIIFDHEYTEYLITRGYEETLKRNIDIYNFFKS